MTTPLNPHHRADGTRKRIIRAAKSMFVKNGFTNVSMEKIAKKAGVNHSLIYHHFGDKENLWQSVKNDIIATSEKRNPILPSTDLAWPTFLREAIKLTMDFYRDNPDIVTLIGYQRLAKKKANRDVNAISPSSKAWIEAIRHYQEQGDISSEYSPAYISCYIVSIVCSIIIDDQPLIPDNDANVDFVECCYQWILNGLIKPNP